MSDQKDANEFRMNRPGFGHFITETFRAFGERIQARDTLANYDKDHHGDGHPVLIIPGFMASPASTGPLRKFVNRLGYKAIDWGRGRNYARLEDLEPLRDLVDKTYEEHGTTMSLIGWSLGGVYARQLAVDRPHMIRRVITLASPYHNILAPNNAEWVFRMIKGKRIDEVDPKWLKDLPETLPMPSVAIYSKEDGVVPWQACMNPDENGNHLNIEVKSSHIGMGVNKEVLKIIAHHLSLVL